MPYVQMPGGGWAHIKMAKARLRMCAVCRKRPSTSLCDFQLGEDRTCDLPMCDGCKTPVGLDLDYCPRHHEQDEAMALQGHLFGSE